MLTLDEVAKELKVSKRTVSRLIKKGKLKATQVGRQWRIREEDLEYLIEGEQRQ